MYAIIVTGGKQYRVMKDEVLRVEKLDAEAGANVEINEVLLVGNGDSVTVGTPTVALSFMVQEPSGIMARSSARSRSDSLRR